MTEKQPTLALATTPGVDHIVTSYLEARERGVEKFNEGLKELAEVFGEERWSVRHSYDGLWIYGYEHSGEPDYQPPAGWRKEASTGLYRPALRSKLGKEHDAKLSAYNYKYPKYPGLPRIIWGEGWMGTWTLEHLGGRGFATISTPLGERTDDQTRLSEVDWNLWERVPLSTYHLAKENHHD